jgi:long-chain acyl-CoA synthetase
VLNEKEWINVAHQLLLVDPFKAASLTGTKVQNHVMARLRKQLQAFPSYAKVRRVILTLEAWTVDNGLLTPTLKLKRNKVLEHYAREISSIYNQ